MGQILHGSATTTQAVRAAIQRSKAPLKELAARHGLNPKTVAKWRNDLTGSVEPTIQKQNYDKTLTIADVCDGPPSKEQWGEIFELICRQMLETLTPAFRTIKLST